MKRIDTKLLISAAIFSAAINMNACAYGPPQDQMVQLSHIHKTEEQTEESEIPETDIKISNARNEKTADMTMEEF